MKTIDTRGKLCPQPLIMARKAIREAKPGEWLCILSDNETACSNLSDYLHEMKLTFVSETENNITSLRFQLPEVVLDEIPASIACTPASGYAIVIKSEQMGNGDEDLGNLLMRAFINSLLETEKLPVCMIFYNSGVKLALKDTDTAQSLRQLEDRGVRIMACGTCLDFYGVKEQLAVGQVSNMYKITDALAKAGHIIYP